MGVTESKYSESYQIFRSNYKKEVLKQNPSLGGYVMLQHKYQQNKFVLEKIKKLSSIENLENS